MNIVIFAFQHRNEAVLLRHDRAHRNAFDKEGNQIDVFTKALVQDTADVIKGFVEAIQQTCICGLLSGRLRSTSPPAGKKEDSMSPFGRTELDSGWPRWGRFLPLRPKQTRPLLGALLTGCHCTIEADKYRMMDVELVFRATCWARVSSSQAEKGRHLTYITLRQSAFN